MFPGFQEKSPFPLHPLMKHSLALTRLPPRYCLHFQRLVGHLLLCPAPFSCFSRLFWSPVGGLGQKAAQPTEGREMLSMGLIKAGAFFFFFTRTQNSYFQYNRRITTESAGHSNCKFCWMVTLWRRQPGCCSSPVCTGELWSNHPGTGGAAGSIPQGSVFLNLLISTLACQAVLKAPKQSPSFIR